MAYGKGRAAKVSSRMGKGRAGKKTVLSSPYQNVVADIHRGRRGGRKR
jgi:hypothetical protein